MIKKITSDWRMALIFYFIGNILAAVPTFLFFRLVPLIPGNIWVRLVISLIGSLALFYLAFTLSGSYISKHYIIKRRQGIIRWTVGYILVFNILLWLSKYSNDMFGLGSVIALFGLLMFTVVLVVFVPKSLLVASKEETDKALLENIPKPPKQAARTGMVFGYVFAELALDAFVGGLLGMVIVFNPEKASLIKELVFLFQSVVIVVLVVWLFRATLASRRYAWMAGIISAALQAILFTVAALFLGVKGVTLYITILYLPLYLLAPVFVPRIFNKIKSRTMPGQNKGDRPL